MADDPGVHDALKLLPRRLVHVRRLQHSVQGASLGQGLVAARQAQHRPPLLLLLLLILCPRQARAWRHVQQHQVPHGGAGLLEVAQLEGFERDFELVGGRRRQAAQPALGARGGGLHAAISIWGRRRRARCPPSTRTPLPPAGCADGGGGCLKRRRCAARRAAAGCCQHAGACAGDHAGVHWRALPGFCCRMARAAGPPGRGRGGQLPATCGDDLAGILLWARATQSGLPTDTTAATQVAQRAQRQPGIAPATVPPGSPRASLRPASACCAARAAQHHGSGAGRGPQAAGTDTFRRGAAGADRECLLRGRFSGAGMQGGRAGGRC